MTVTAEIICVALLIFFILFFHDSEEKPVVRDDRELPEQSSKFDKIPNARLSVLPKVLAPGDQEICFEFEVDNSSDSNPIYAWHVDDAAAPYFESSDSRIFIPVLPPECQSFFDQHGLVAICILSRAFTKKDEYPHQDCVELYIYRQAATALFCIDCDRIHARAAEQSADLLVQASTFVKRWDPRSSYGTSFTYLSTNDAAMHEATAISKRQLDHYDQSSYRFADSRWETIKQFLENLS